MRWSVLLTLLGVGLCGLAATAPTSNTSTTSEVAKATPSSEKSSQKLDQKTKEQPAKPTAVNNKDSDEKAKDQKDNNTNASLECTADAKSNTNAQVNEPEKVPTVIQAPTNTPTPLKEQLSDKDYYNIWVDYMFAAYRIDSPEQDVLSRSENTKNAKVTATQGFDDYPAIRWYVAVNEIDKYVVVVFRGSDPDSYYLTALDARKRAWPPKTQAEVHRGAIDGYLRLNEPLKQHHRELMKKYPGYDHRIVGHSLGGVQATYYALESKDFLGNSLVDVVTLAQFRPGDQGFKEIWDAKHIPYSPLGNQNDIVIYSPPSTLGFVSLAPPILVTATNGDLVNCGIEKQALERKSLCTQDQPSELDIAAHGIFLSNDGSQFGPKLSSRA